MASKLRRRHALLAGVAVIAVVVVAAVVPGPSASRRPADQAKLLSNALSKLPGSTQSAVGAALAHLSASTTAGAQPNCSLQSLGLVTPKAQFPNGTAGLGIPFVAELTGGELLSGYHVGWLGPSTKANPHPTDPWALTLTGITGWVTGLLEVPSLAADVNPTTGIGFCDDRGLAFQQVQGAKPPQTTLPRTPYLRFTLVTSTIAADNTQNYQPPVGNKAPSVGSYAPEFFTLQPSAKVAPKLTVSGVGAGGVLNLSGSTEADTSVAVWNNVAKSTKDPSDYVLAQTCNQFPGRTTINVGTVAQGEPAGGPPSATLQFSPQPLSGGFPRAGNTTPASATLVGNDFPIAAFNVSDTLKSPCGFGIALNGSLSGFQPPSPGQPEQPRDLCLPTYTPGAANCPYIASQPGWSQFTVKATIETLGLPYGVPQGFGF